MHPSTTLPLTRQPTNPTSTLNHLRAAALKYLARPVVNKNGIPGWDDAFHQLVIPKPPFKPGTKQRWPDKGAHITVAMTNHDEDDPGDIITEEAMVLHGREVRSGSLGEMTRQHFSPKAFHSAKHFRIVLYHTSLQVDIGFEDPILLEGRANNDEACQCCFYLALETDRATDEAIEKLREEIGLDTTHHHKFHLSVAGVAPAGPTPSSAEALAGFRAEWIPSPADNNLRERSGATATATARGMAPIRTDLMRNADRATKEARDLESAEERSQVEEDAKAEENAAEQLLMGTHSGSSQCDISIGMTGPGRPVNSTTQPPPVGT
mmetsp:Transcript_32524/g.75287  ORF Transcript_32524/g.75287 Transcript_32524/m.75287 type:complete len:322 (+) Transcript_32524:573-1538(+)